MNVRVAIADDHAIVRRGLRNLLDAEPEFTVVAEAEDVAGARRCVRGHHPDVLILDLNMQGMSGLEVQHKVVQSGHGIPVIFITAYPERFLTGTPPEPAFLITKPFSIESLKAVVSQALFFDRRSHRSDDSAVRGALV